MSFLFVLSGKKQHGKDSAAVIIRECLVSEYSYDPDKIKVVSFAFPLKSTCAELFPDVPLQCWNGEENEKNKPLTILNPMPDIWKILLHASIDQTWWTGRAIMQALGTNFGRAIDDNVWVDKWECAIKNELSKGAEAILCTDCRFPNEINKANACGAHTLRIVRVNPDRSLYRNSMDDHESETALDDYPWMENEVIYAVDLDGLRKKVTAWLKRIIVITKSAA